MHKIYNLNTKCRSKYNKKNAFIIIERKATKCTKNDIKDATKSIITYVSIISI